MERILVSHPCIFGWINATEDGVVGLLYGPENGTIPDEHKDDYPEARGRLTIVSERASRYSEKIEWTSAVDPGETFGELNENTCELDDEKLVYKNNWSSFFVNSL